MTATITLAQQKGGAGKTTALVQIAVAAAMAGRRVAAIDLDPQGTLTRWAALREARPGAAPVRAEAATDWRAGVEIRRVAWDADLVLVDCPGGADEMLRAAVRESDLMLIPCQPASPDIWATIDTVAMAQKAGCPHAVLLNRVAPRGLAADAAAATLVEAGAALLPARLGARIAFATSFAQGAGVAETAPRSKAAAEAAALYAARAPWL